MTFPIFRATIYDGPTPALDAMNWPVCAWPEDGDFCTDGIIDPLKVALTGAKLRASGVKLVAIDIEATPLLPSQRCQIIASLRGYGLTAGCFTNAPSDGDNRGIVGQSANSGVRQAWYQDNSNVACIAAVSDATFPDLYPYHADLASWLDYAKSMIGAAMAYGKPVIPFITPRYIDGIVGPGYTTNNPAIQSLKWQYLPPDYWQAVVSLVRQHCDGMVIWGGGWAGGPDALPWNAAQDGLWLNTVKQFAA